MAQAHAVLLNIILLEVQRAHPKCRVFKRTVGSYRQVSQPEVIVSVGVDGACDIYGFVPGSPAVPFEIEVKVGHDRIRPRQVDYHRMLASLGVPMMIAHSPTTADFKPTAQRVVDWVATLPQAPNGRPSN